MLGLIHRSVLGEGPAHFSGFFQRVEGPQSKHGLEMHPWQLQEYRSGHSSDYALPGSRPAEFIWRSALGLVTIYNLLPPSIVLGSPDVRCFQAKLQNLVKSRAKQQGSEDWSSLLSARWDLLHHPLIKLRTASETQVKML